ncbi:hypothetical protein K8I85_02695 [bacterium]|nr:hypothetical protein [bacterium]
MFHRFRLLWIAPVALVWGCTNANVRLNPGFDDREDDAAYHDTMSPDAFVDRLGEPDEWRNEGEGDDLRMVAIWNCLDDHRREITWRIAHDDHGGRQYWRVENDRRTDCVE